MSADRPRKEPEIIPPDRGGNGRTQHQSHVHISLMTSRGEARFAPGPIWLILIFLGLGFVGLLLVVLVAGLFLLWIPALVIALAILALLRGSIPRLWRQRDKP